MIKNLVFDFGGVIADLNRQGAVDAFIAIGLKDADTRLDKYHQTGIFQELEEGRISDSEFIRIMEELCQRSLTWPEVQQAWLGFLSGVDLKKLHLLEELRQEGYHLYLLSNTNPFVMGWACSKDFTSEGKSLAEYFDRLYLSYKVGCTKPDKKIFTHMLEDAKILPEETLFVDDGAANIQVGQELGMHTFCPKNATDWRDELKNLIKREK